MGISHYLAMTDGEIADADELPKHLAYMACHFSPYTTGLTQPPQLPPQAMLILNDRIPFCGHDYEQIAAVLASWVEKLQLRCLLLDFQRPDTPKELVKHLVGSSPLPIGVSAAFADNLPCAVFLPPVPPDVSPEEHIKPWTGREIWLDAAVEALQITVDTEGSHRQAVLSQPSQAFPFRDATLCCRYKTQVLPDRAIFTLQRTQEDLQQLLAGVAPLGVTTAVSLYQETKKLPVK